MKSTPYIPAPIKTDHITLPPDLLPLLELLAKNTHEHWAKARMAEGWSYGEKRNDDLKQTPALRPYEELAESEKDYDRTTSTETLKLILALGFRISKQEQ